MQRRSLLVSSAVSLVLAAIVAACSSSSDTSSGTPSPTNEAGAADDVAAKRDAPPLVDANSGGGCAPADVASFKPPTWIPPAPFGQAKCTDAQMQAILACNLDENADQATCDKLLADPANTECNDCLITDASKATALGPLYIDGNYIDVNVAGCVANIDGDPSANGCGAKYQAEMTCEDQACADNCSGTGDAAYQDYQSCLQQAAAGGCKSFATDGKCADPLIAKGGKAETCIPNSGDIMVDAKRIAALFCGGAVSDGGADAPHDAATDG